MFTFKFPTANIPATPNLISKGIEIVWNNLFGSEIGQINTTQQDSVHYKIQ